MARGAGAAEDGAGGVGGAAALKFVALVILTSSDRFAATSSIKEEEGDYRCRSA